MLFIHKLADPPGVAISDSMYSLSLLRGLDSLIDLYDGVDTQNSGFSYISFANEYSDVI